MRVFLKKGDVNKKNSAAGRGICRLCGREPELKTLVYLLLIIPIGATLPSYHIDFMMAKCRTVVELHLEMEFSILQSNGKELFSSNAFLLNETAKCLTFTNAQA